MIRFRLIKRGLGVSMSVYAISDLEQKVGAVTELEAEVTRPETPIFSGCSFLKLAAWKGQERKRSNRSTAVKFNSLQVLDNMERETRIELATNSLEGCDSTIELLPQPV